MEKPDRSKFPNQGAYDQAYDRWSENQQGAMPTKPGPISDQQKEVALRWQTALEEIGAMVGMKVGGNLSTDVAPLVRAAIDRQSGPAPALIIPMNELLTDEQCERIRCTAALSADSWSESQEFEPTQAQVDGVYIRAIIKAVEGEKP